MQLMVETANLTAESLSLMLIRKHDWHDYEGVRYLLESGAAPNYQRQRGWLAIHHAIVRDNALEIIDLLLDHGADPTLLKDGASAVALAARRGRGDLLALFERRGVAIDLHGVDGLIAACATNHAADVRATPDPEPQPVAKRPGKRGTSARGS